MSGTRDAVALNEASRARAAVSSAPCPADGPKLKADSKGVATAAHSAESPSWGSGQSGPVYVCHC